MEREYWDEFTHLITVAVFVTFFVVSFKYFGKIALAKVPAAAGLQEALAA